MTAADAAPDTGGVEIDGVRSIKRIVALPSDLLEMRSEAIFVNGKAAEYSEPEVL